ncbi:MAG TPA: retroviral-like aspartic protease family protein [Caulobacteraceae bacterium]|nr:retroviral-like aspartic protease family protein [Caulobacteraceae bacterium]
MTAGETPGDLGPMFHPPRRRRKRLNVGLIVLATVAVLGAGGGWAVLKYGAKVVPASALPGGVPSLEHANACLRNRQFMCAQADYIAYLKKYPDDPHPNAQLAILLTMDGRHKESLKYYAKAKSLGISTYDFHARHAESLEATGDLKGAMAANYAALEIMPNLVDVRGSLATQLVRAGRRQEALNLLETFDRSLADRGHPGYFGHRIDEIKRGMGQAVDTTHLAPDEAAAAPVEGLTRVTLRREPGVLFVPVKLNGLVEAEFVVDSGASHVVLSDDVFRELVRSGSLREADHRGSGFALLADGSRVKAEAYNLRSLKVGGRTLHNVTAMVSPGREGTLLLGQSFLRRFKSWSIDNQKGVLELRE